MILFGFEITGYQIAFLALAGVTLGSALMVVLMPNILRAALFLGLTLFGTAGLYVLMNAPFLAAVQVMIYVGAITTMIILAIFLSSRVMSVGFSQAIYNPVLAFGAAGVMFLFLFVTIANSIWVKRIAAEGPTNSNVGVHAVAAALLQPYVFPFELASLVLLAVLVGAIVIAKEDQPGEP
ncbi:MAG: NADH-quinone oxidoreductase subunit J [Armatimonadetes bacterium]|nr:NADH-quinone oxidoreductase subunit J [Armatimonadota bacterium]